jgi:hypothetical protein
LQSRWGLRAVAGYFALAPASPAKQVDADLDRMSDFDLVGGEVSPLDAGRPIAVLRRGPSGDRLDPAAVLLGRLSTRSGNGVHISDHRLAPAGSCFIPFRG